MTSPRKEVQERAAADIASLPNRKLTGADFLERHPMDALTDTQQTKATTTFDCPVGITCKVAIFSMCGTCYDDNAATQSFSAVGYEQRSFVTLFGGSTNATDAVESLYQRATKHGSDTSYDQTYGCTEGTNDGGGTWCTYLNWNSIIGLGVPSSSVSGLKGGTDLIYALDDTYPMSSSGGSSSVIQDSISAIQGEAQPILPIASTYIPWQVDNDWSLDRAFELSVGETLPISSYRVKACDKDAVDYYGFVATKGTWKIVDANGQETNLNSVETLTVTAYDTTGKEVEPDVSWEAQELASKGITVTPPGFSHFSIRNRFENTKENAAPWNKKSRRSVFPPYSLARIKIDNQKCEQGIFAIDISMTDRGIKCQGVPLGQGIIACFCLEDQLPLHNVNILLCFFGMADGGVGAVGV